MNVREREELLKKFELVEKREITNKGEVIHLASMRSNDTYRSNPGESFEDFMTRIIGWCFFNYD